MRIAFADNKPTNDNPVTPQDPDDNNILGGGPNAGEDEDDHDPAAPMIVDLALKKEIITAAPYSYGQAVTFRITIENQGNETATNILISDYVPEICICCQQWMDRLCSTHHKDNGWAISPWSNDNS